MRMGKIQLPSSLRFEVYYKSILFVAYTLAHVACQLIRPWGSSYLNHSDGTRVTGGLNVQPLRRFENVFSSALGFSS
jgi:hypothetical protein